MQEHSRLTPKLALNLAAPHTWPASIMPCLVAVSACAVWQGYVQAGLSLILLLICIFFQASVNTFNDYFDYVKGTDGEDDNLEADDSVLVNNKVNPKSVLALAIVYLAIPFALGIYLILLKGPAPLIVALIGAAIVVLYSAGKTPISYLPIGEFVSGFVMGMLIPLGVGTVLLGEFHPLLMLIALPQFLLIGLIMQTNNTCDIEKDVDAQRKTLPVLLGRAKSRRLYHVLLIASPLATLALTAVLFTNGLWVGVVMLIASWPLLKGLLKNPLLPASRIAAMGGICSVNVALGSFYCAAILASCIPLCL